MAWSRSAFQSWSRPAIICASSCGRCRIRQAAGLCADSAIASSSSGLYLTIAAGLEPAARGEDHLRLGVVDAGRELARREAAEHHRMHRADARAGEHADHRLRHHRHVEDDAVALLDAEVAQQRRQHLHLGEQQVVGEDALGSGERRIVDDRRLRAAAAHHMAVDRVPAGVADGVGEPAAVDAGVRIEDPFRRLVPVDVARGLGPELLRIAPPALILVMVAAGAGIHGSLPVQQDDAPQFVLSLHDRHCHSAIMLLQAAAGRR